jgi:hypothetical protein
MFDREGHGHEAGDEGYWLMWVATNNLDVQGRQVSPIEIFHLHHLQNVSTELSYFLQFYCMNKSINDKPPFAPIVKEPARLKYINAFRI